MFSHRDLRRELHALKRRRRWLRGSVRVILYLSRLYGFRHRTRLNRIQDEIRDIESHIEYLKEQR